MYICRSLLKHGYSNFSCPEGKIWEYCEPSELLIREKYYIDLLGSEYNTVKDPTLPPMSGRKHSDKTRKIISETKKGENNPMFGKTGENSPMFGKNNSD
jgi:group I intron endonuclease